MDPADLAPESPARDRDSPGVAPSMFGATEGAQEPPRLDEMAGVEEAGASAEDRLQAAGVVGAAKAATAGNDDGAGGGVVDDSEAREDGEYARGLQEGGEVEHEMPAEGSSAPGGTLSRRRERSASDEDEEEVAQSSNAVNADDLDYSAQDAKARRRAELDAQIAAATKAGKKRPRKKKGDEIDLDREADEEINEVRENMLRAADEDFDANKEHRPATAKLRMLPMVVDTLQKVNLQQSIMDNNLLQGVRRWLEPLNDKSLPSLNIQRAFFPLLLRMEIDTITLKMSGLGKIVLFYTKCGRVDPAIRRMADKLIDNWSRPILKRSASNRARQQAITQHEKLRRQADQARRRELGEMVEDDEADEADRLATKAAAEGSQARDAAQAKLNRFKRLLREGKK